MWSGRCLETPPIAARPHEFRTEGAPRCRDCPQRYRVASIARCGSAFELGFELVKGLIAFSLLALLKAKCLPQDFAGRLVAKLGLALKKCVQFRCDRNLDGCSIGNMCQNFYSPRKTASRGNRIPPARAVSLPSTSCRRPSSNVKAFFRRGSTTQTVSYTHLTLPTNREV